VPINGVEHLLQTSNAARHVRTKVVWMQPKMQHAAPLGPACLGRDPRQMKLPSRLRQIDPNEQRRLGTAIGVRAATCPPWRQRIHHSKAAHDRMIGVTRKLVIPGALVNAPNIDSVAAIERNKRYLISRKHQACRSDRKLLANLRTLDRNILREKLSRWLTNAEIDGIVTRAGIIAGFFDKQTVRGEGSVLYDFPRSQQACGVGL